MPKKKKPVAKKKNPEGDKLRAWLVEKGLSLYTEGAPAKPEGASLHHSVGSPPNCLDLALKSAALLNTNPTEWMATTAVATEQSCVVATFAAVLLSFLKAGYPPSDWVGTLDGLAAEDVLEPFLKSVREHYAKVRSKTWVAHPRPWPFQW